MSAKKPVVIYGVTGYTGRLVAEYCREFNIPFIAAGRNGASIKDVLSKVPGIETADYEIAEVKEHSVASLRALLKGAKADGKLDIAFTLRPDAKPAVFQGSLKGLADGMAALPD